MLLLVALYLVVSHDCVLVCDQSYHCTADGDISFGAGVIRPTFRFRADDVPEDRVVTFNVINDNVVEGQEIGQLQIVRSTSFDGFTPLFQNVRIIINDTNSELK